jgi:5-methylcytosine-specific restriction endonuclease McrA
MASKRKDLQTKEWRTTIRQAILERDGHICAGCLNPVEGPDATVDHIFAYSAGPATVRREQSYNSGQDSLSRGGVSHPSKQQTDGWGTAQIKPNRFF